MPLRSANFEHESSDCACAHLSQLEGMLFSCVFVGGSALLLVVPDVVGALVLAMLAGVLLAFEVTVVAVPAEERDVELEVLVFVTPGVVAVKFDEGST